LYQYSSIISIDFRCGLSGAQRTRRADAFHVAFVGHYQVAENFVERLPRKIRRTFIIVEKIFICREFDGLLIPSASS